jgi:membrane associated rhomboid family serine protease
LERKETRNLKWGTIKDLAREVPSRLVYYGLILLAGVVLFAPANFLPPLNPSTPILSACNYTALCASSRTPWGAVTSIFMFDTSNNIGLFADLAVVFLFSNFVYSPQETRRRCSFVVASMYVSGIIPNLLSLVLRPNVQFYGPSGVVYGFLGVVLGLSIFNLFPSKLEGLNFPKLRTYYLNLRNSTLAVLSAVVFVYVFGLFVTNPAAFLSVGPNVNVFAHSLGFILGFASTYIYWYLTHKRW